MLGVDVARLADTEERAQLRQVVRDLFAEAGDDLLWSRLAGEVGVQGMAIPEEFGGSGFAFADLAVVLEEAGRALRGGPLLATSVLATYALLGTGDHDACARYLPRIADGTLTATLCGFPDGGFGAGAPSSPGSGLRAEWSSDGWRGHGQADFVLDGTDADLVLVVARTPDGPGLFATAGEGVTRTGRPVLDGTRPQALISLDHAPLTPIGTLASTVPAVERALDVARAALAAEQVGGSAHALDATVAYVHTRQQFGRPIGAFQAVKHRLADLLVELEAARSAAALAAACVDSGSADLPVAASAAKVVCSETAVLAAAEYVQFHGGVGFTWEHAAHRYVRRARSSEVLFGTPDDHRARLADLLTL
jgi:alkylation response protein AidB-like acyl-CoA dehydrogenase